MQNVEELKEAFKVNPNMEFIFFWKPKRYPGGIIKESCLSQWWRSWFVVDGKTYTSAEQFMMQQKAALFKDAEIEKEIMVSYDPSKIKALGRKVKNFDDAVWIKHAYDIVVKGNIAKFSQDQALLDFLLSTGDKVLVEASAFDAIWGVKMSSNDPLITDPANWKGKNLLGFAIMEARAQIISQGITKAIKVEV